MSDIKEILITDIEEFDSVDVVNILVSVGDEIDVDQALITIESEKAMMDFPSPYAGIIKKINVIEGGKVKEGDSLVSLELIGETNTHTAAKKISVARPNTEDSERQKIDTGKKDPNKKQASEKAYVIPDSNDAYASPGVHKYARELGVDIQTVPGSGRAQRVKTEDVQTYVRTQLGAKQISNATQVKPLDFSAYGETEAVAQTKIQKVTAKNMTTAWQTIPHVTHFDQADVTLLEEHRKQLSVELKEKNIKLTPLVFIIKALCATLKKFPNFNASLDIATEQIIYKKYIDIGIAVDTPHGLMVPVLRSVDKKSITQLAIELLALSDLARQRKLSPKQMGGGSMTISSLGILGGQAFTPIINPPEVAILGISKMFKQESVSNRNTKEKKILPLALSYDHRVINGAEAARFCTYLKEVLEDIWKVIL